MQPDDREQIYWALSELAEGKALDDTLVAESTLEAYRNGDLTDAEASDVERLLVRNQANRRRLEAIAGATPADASNATRNRVLDAAIRSVPLIPARRFWQPLVAAAAAVLLVVTLSWLVWQPTSSPPAYQVSLEALTDRRDAATPGLTAEAYVDSRVKITATVTEDAIDGVEVGLYRQLGQQLERLPIGDRLKIEQRRGVVVFSALASDLVGSELGVYEVFVGIAWRAELPVEIKLEPGDDPAKVLAAGGKRQVHQLTLRLLAESSATPFNGQPSD